MKKIASSLSSSVSGSLSRRQFVRDAAFLTGAASATLVAGAESGGSGGGGAGDGTLAPLKAPVGTLPMGKIGNLEFSRLMLGGNLISGYAHSRDLRYVAPLMRHYNTESKILETLEIAESLGINSINLAAWDDSSFLQKHWKRGGKMKWIAQSLPGDHGDLTPFKKAVDLGACAVHIQGHGSERLIDENRVEEIGRIVNYIREQKAVAGVAAHSLDVVVRCEKAGVNPDFYQKTLHTLDYYTAPRPDEKGFLGSHDNSWCNNPDEVADVMFNLKRPWIAFKVMAAGAIPPQKGFQYAFDSGADFVLAGMFDFQIAENVEILKSVLGRVNRTRPWIG